MSKNNRHGCKYLAIFTFIIYTNLCKPDDGQARPKHVADVIRCRLQLSIVLCKDGLTQNFFHVCTAGWKQSNSSSPIQAVQFKFSAWCMICEVEISVAYTEDATKLMASLESNLADDGFLLSRNTLH